MVSVLVKVWAELKSLLTSRSQADWEGFLQELQVRNSQHCSPAATVLSWFSPLNFSLLILAFFPSLTGNRSGLDLSKWCTLSREPPVVFSVVSKLSFLS